VEDDERNGHPRSHRTGENVGKVRKLMHSGRRVSIRAVVVYLRLDKQ
jgi:hypothetical protein